MFIGSDILVYSWRIVLISMLEIHLDLANYSYSEVG